MQKNLTMRDLPETERPYEKCIHQGPEHLSDAELLSAIIRTGSHGEKSLDLAERILMARSHGILNILYMDIHELQKIHGIGPVKAVQLKCIGELAKRISGRTRSQSYIFKTPEEVAQYYMEQLRHEPKEILLLAMFDRKNMLIHDEIVTIGTSHASLVSPGEIFKTALKNKAEYIILLHNHPSGDPQPSREDLRVTNQIQKCGDLLEIPLVDHIIIGDQQYFSFCEHDLLKDRKGD